MIAEAIQKILALAAPNLITVREHQYSDKNLHMISDPVIDDIETGTLTSIVDLVKTKFESIEPDHLLIHIENWRRVHLMANVSNQDMRRTTYCIADWDKFAPNKPTFGQFMPTEAFAIMIQSLFDQAGDAEYLLKLCSSITTDRVRTDEDDGVSQKVTVQAGVTLKKEMSVKSRVKLYPFRTFNEVAQPGSDFLLRVRGDEDEAPTLAIFEADGGVWKYDAVKSIKSFFATNLPDVDIIA